MSLPTAFQQCLPSAFSTRKCLHWIGFAIIGTFFAFNHRLLTKAGFFSSYAKDFYMVDTSKISPSTRKKYSKISPLVIQKDYPFTFSACLIVKDDNRILPEWLAYHYTVMPLRQLIVLPDPLSITSPEPILEKFREIGMNITFWADKDFNSMADKWYSKAASPEDNGDRKYSAHLYRQLQFYHKCLVHFKDLNINSTWTMFIDSDEFIVFNNYFESEMKKNKTQNTEDLRFHLPKIGTSTVSEYIAKAIKSDKACWGKLPCDVLPRLIFGSFEGNADQIAAQVPGGFDALSFNTMRFRSHENPEKKGRDIGKSIIDASRWNGQFPSGIHRINNECCHPWPSILEAELRIHHYTGPLKTFLRSKDGDDSRGEATYKNRNAGVDPNLTNDDIRGWLQAFVDTVGQREALELTEKLREWAVADYDRASAQLEQGNFTYPFYKPVNSTG